jgi:hypothetical protein
MNPDEREHLINLLDINRRRLRALELQAAQFGIYAPPHIMIEIKDTQREIAELERKLGTSATTEPKAGQAEQPRDVEAPRPLDNRQLATLAELLLRTSAMRSRTTRETILQQLPTSIQNAILRSDNPKADVLNIVRVASSYAGGLEELLAAVRFFEEDSREMLAVERFVAELR